MIDDDDRDELEPIETPRSTSHGSSTRSPATRSPAGDTIRDARLRELSSEHHAALVWARRLRRGVDRQPMAERFARELEPHFAIEETILAPALRACGEHALVDRLLAEHATLRRLAAADAHEAFGTALHDHVRFEERELFPRCEVVLAGDVLDAVLRASGSKR
ncbi:MAG: hemerythrin domain-containing protein [Myxococcota bacterium]|nr:hemerythrin domain-containing protein [Myxococcota bacterium]